MNETNAFDNEAVRRQFIRRTGGEDALHLRDFKWLLYAVLREYGTSDGKLPSDKDLGAAFYVADADKNGTIDEDEVRS